MHGREWRPRARRLASSRSADRLLDVPARQVALVPLDHPRIGMAEYLRRDDHGQAAALPDPLICPGMPEPVKGRRRLDPRRPAGCPGGRSWCDIPHGAPVRPQQHPLPPAAPGADGAKKASGLLVQLDVARPAALGLADVQRAASGLTSPTSSRHSSPYRQPVSSAARTSRRKSGGPGVQEPRALVLREPTQPRPVDVRERHGCYINAARGLPPSSCAGRTPASSRGCVRT